MNKYLSIIIPIYNVEKYLERCLNSILEKKEDFEIILVDDGSKDMSAKICKEYEQKYKNVSYYYKENGGASDARNYGMKFAKGDYIWFIDSDDYITTYSITEIINIIQNKKDDVIVCQSKKVFEDGNIIDECNYSIKQGEYTSHEFMSQLKENPKSVIFCPQYYIVRREFVINNKIYFHKGIIYEDELWIPQLLIKAKKIYYSGLNIYFHCMRNESVMHSTDLEKCGYSAWVVANELFKIYGESDRKDLEFLRDRCTNILLQAVWKNTKVVSLYDIRKVPIKNAYYLKTKIKSMLYFISPKYYIFIHNILKK
jgi:glycosyltransferase